MIYFGELSNILDRRLKFTAIVLDTLVGDARDWLILEHGHIIIKSTQNLGSSKNCLCKAFTGIG